MQLAKEVSALDANVGAWGADKAAAAKSREEEHHLYLEQHSDYIASIESVDDAVRTVQAEGNGQSALVQLAKAKRLPAKARQELASFLQGDPLTAMLQDAAEWGTPEAAAYKSHSGGILETAQGLGDKFQTEKHDLEQRETNAAQAYQLMAANLDNQIAFAKKEIELKASVKAER